MRKGITLVVLTITLVIMIILISVVVISGSNIVDNTKIKRFGTEMYSVKSLTEEYEFMYGKYPLEDNVIEFDISSIDNEYKNQFEGENIVNNKISLYKIDYSKAGIRELNRGFGKLDKLDVYVYSKSTNKIYYLYGEEIDHFKYYTLTDEIYKEIGINEIN